MESSPNKLIVNIEKTDMGYNAYSMQILGCIITGHKKDEIEKEWNKVLKSHLKALKEYSAPIPYILTTKYITEFIYPD